MPWTDSQILALAMPSCTRCKGSGLTQPKTRVPITCLCVYRAACRGCLQKFKQCVERDRSISPVDLEIVRTSQGRKHMYGRKREEYLADFYLIAKRTLSAAEHQLFKYHYLLGADWKLCCVRLGMNRGNFFHACYRIEQKLGKAFVETEPYGLYPPDQYFASGGKGVAAFIPAPVIPQPSRPPLA